jgi:hypothetical protein
LFQRNAELLAERGFDALEIFFSEKKFLLGVGVPPRKVVDCSGELVEPCPSALAIQLHRRYPCNPILGCAERDDNDVRVTTKANRHSV